MEKIKFIDVTYYSHTEYTTPQQIFERHKQSLGYIDFIKNQFEVEVIKHLNYEGYEFNNGVKYWFFKSRNKFYHIPFKTNGYIKTAKPDVILIQGLIFPVQAIALRLLLGRKPVIIAQHHGEPPFTGWKKIFQKFSDKCITAYLFTALENAEPFIKNKIISGRHKCFEVLEASVNFTPFDKKHSRLRIGIDGENIFLWVGRLDINKDPLTVLKAFEKFLQRGNSASLYMFYQTEELIHEVKEFIDKKKLLTNAVFLKGEADNKELAYWYSAADYYISGSHRESTGFALLEAMACGCICVVTTIPSFKKITGNGSYAKLFEAGNAENLLEVLSGLKTLNKEEFSVLTKHHFNTNLSFESIADRMAEIVQLLRIK